MLKQRIITAVMLLIVLGGVLLFTPPTFFCVFVGIVLLVAAWEWANLCNIESLWMRYIYAAFTASVGLSGWWLIEIEAFTFWTTQSALILAALWWSVALLWVQGFPSSRVFWGTTAVRMIMGLFVMLPTWLGMSYLRLMPNGVYLVLSVVFIVATADSGAYFFGKMFGKRKLAPTVSPGKSWEGVFGGLLAVALVGALFCWISNRSDVLVVLAIILPTALVSVLGDLLESMLKRHRGVKDSSHLLPGHGGILDRVDGLAAAVPIFSLAVLTSGWQW